MNISHVTYRGERLIGPADEAIGVRVTANRSLLIPVKSRLFADPEPCGFEWGYGGAGPMSLALALLIDSTGDEDLAHRCCRWFMWAVVSQWGDRWQIADAEIRDWIHRWATERSGPADDAVVVEIGGEA